MRRGLLTSTDRDQKPHKTHKAEPVVRRPCCGPPLTVTRRRRRSRRRRRCAVSVDPPLTSQHEKKHHDSKPVRRDLYTLTDAARSTTRRPSTASATRTRSSTERIRSERTIGAVCRPFAFFSWAVVLPLYACIANLSRFSRPRGRTRWRHRSTPQVIARRARARRDRFIAPIARPPRSLARASRMPASAKRTMDEAALAQSPPSPSKALKLSSSPPSPVSSFNPKSRRTSFGSAVNGKSGCARPRPRS